MRPTTKRGITTITAFRSKYLAKETKKSFFSPVPSGGIIPPPKYIRVLAAESRVWATTNLICESQGVFISSRAKTTAALPQATLVQEGPQESLPVLKIYGPAIVRIHQVQIPKLASLVQVRNARRG